MTTKNILNENNIKILLAVAGGVIGIILFVKTTNSVLEAIGLKESTEDKLKKRDEAKQLTTTCKTSS